MALSFDLSGLPLLEAEVAALQAQQAAVPTSFTGGTVFGVTYRGTAPANLAITGSTPGSMTTAQLVQRLQALLLAAQSLPL